MSRPFRAGGWFCHEVFDMSRCSPPSKRGAVGPVFFLLYFLVFGGEARAGDVFYRLEKAGDVRCDFGATISIEELNRPGQVDFRLGNNGCFYFIAYELGKLWQFDGGGKLVRSVFLGGTLSHSAAAFSLSPEGDLLILDGRRRALFRYDASLDLLGKFPLFGREVPEEIFGLVATSWGDLLATGGLKMEIWKLEAQGQGYAFQALKPAETYRYFSLQEMPGQRILSADPLGALLVLDRFGNLLHLFSYKKGVRAVPLGRDYLTTFWPDTELAVLDSTGTVLGNWRISELDSTLKKVGGFQVVRDRLYLLDSTRGRIVGFRFLRADSAISPRRKGND